MVVYKLEQRWEVGLRSTYRTYRFRQKKIIFSDEAYFDLGGYVNKQNFRIWGTENPHAHIEKPTHPKRITVWNGFSSRGIIGLFFFANEQERPLQSMEIVMVSTGRATYHTAKATLDVLRPGFEDRHFGAAI